MAASANKGWGARGFVGLGAGRLRVYLETGTTRDGDTPAVEAAAGYRDGRGDGSDLA